jgi:plasmid stabilization system protein ParE
VTPIRWTEPASADLLDIVERLAKENAAAAARVGHRILDTIEMLDATLIWENQDVRPTRVN